MCHVKRGGTLAIIFTILACYSQNITRYAPMLELGDMLFAKDVVYINITDHQVLFSKSIKDVDTQEGVFQLLIQY